MRLPNSSVYYWHLVCEELVLMLIQTIALIIFGNVCISAGISIKLTLVSLMQVAVRLNLGFNLALADVDGNDCMNGIPDGSIEQKLQRELYCGTKFGGKIHLRCACCSYPANIHEIFNYS